MLEKNVYVVGGADGAIKEAIYLSKLAKKVTIIHFEEKLGAIPEFLNKVKASPNMEVCLNSRLNQSFRKGLCGYPGDYFGKNRGKTGHSRSWLWYFVYAGSPQTLRCIP